MNLERKRGDIMKHFRKIWDKCKNEWLVSHKKMSKKEMYSLFLKEFPDCLDITYTAFKNQCSRVGASYTKNNCWRGSRKPRELYAEQLKKDYVRIKVAQPNIWWSKAKWVYAEFHPWEYESIISERSNYVFLDGNNRNFSPENIERVPLYVMGIFNLYGGCEKGNPEITRLRIAQAKLKYAIMDAGERMGLVADGGAGRVFIEERNRRAREYNSTPERKKILAERARKYREKLKIENPEKYKQLQEKQKTYRKDWYRKNKLRKKLNNNK